jgi:hypothetical protein
MKKISFLLIIFSLFSGYTLFSQESSQGTAGRPSLISSGFYLKLGGAFAVGPFHDGQYNDIYNKVLSPPNDKYRLTYLPAKIGPAMDLGFLIYIGPAFANNYVRLGIDATFLSFWFNSSNPTDPESRYEHYYYFVGQKFGPVISVNPIDRLIVDFSYKINANFGYHYDEWKDSDYFKGPPYHQTGGLVDAQYAKYGMEILFQEISINLRYRVMLFGFEYNFGDMKYDNFDDNRPDQVINADTYRLMIGFKF